MAASITAHATLIGRGDATLGQWTEWSGYAFHLRRRLSRAEQARVGEAVDVRGTAEAELRVARTLAALPPGARAEVAQMAAGELTTG